MCSSTSFKGHMFFFIKFKVFNYANRASPVLRSESELVAGVFYAETL